MSSDLVVVLPGILGSTLYQHGRAVWAPTAGALINGIRTFGGSIRRLQLPADLGDEHPGDGVEARSLIPSLHSLPGIWSPIAGYSALVSRLRSLGYTEDKGNLLLFPYDWRLSNRYNGERLKHVVEPQLKAFRESTPANHTARIVFICHSMGGIVARWYIEQCDGHENTRKLITMGTPYRGATKSLVQLIEGVGVKIGPIGLKFAEFGNSLPSIHQLLPDFACIDDGNELFNLREQVPPSLNRAMVDDAMAFHDTLLTAESNRSQSISDSHFLVGYGQPTTATVRFSNGTVEALETYLGNDHGGDGTVPTAGSLRRGLRADNNALVFAPEKHGNLQSNPQVLNHIEGILTAEPVIFRGVERGFLRVSAPEYVPEGTEVKVSAEFVGADPERLVFTITGEDQPRPVFSQQPQMHNGTFTVTARNLAPGAYTVRVATVGLGTAIPPVTSYLIVWPQSVQDV